MARCEECVHRRVCEEVNGLKCRPDFLWYDAKFGCPYYSAGVEPRAVVDLYKQLNDELEDELAIAYNRLEDARAELAREIFEEVENILNISRRRGTLSYNRQQFDYFFEILKKKYTEGSDNETD